MVLPQPHRDPFLDALRPYVSLVVEELVRHGFAVSASWLDPFDPRDTTIVLRRGDGLQALVYDEETGWRFGDFVSGKQGVRTVLGAARTLNGGLLPKPAEVVRCLVEGDFTTPVMFRRHTDLDDGYEERLRAAGVAGIPVA
ncbi:hypothetical protein BJY16_008849 [Actinoplanes octamycinicus]|uniref:DUF6292 domain-containing protein n=1 Tax=Actinoplanes octamycinicus TaxID=135948 RepID=A0A7W7H7D9_9ACTN|nr:DUF6292 family protein [Actinoplanes octamycinicus]MBB4745390.1 hypothetical protein [Actinoplanes octamycinicus]